MQSSEQEWWKLRYAYRRIDGSDGRGPTRPAKRMGDLTRVNERASTTQRRTEKEWDSVMIWLFNKSLSYLLIISSSYPWRIIFHLITIWSCWHFYKVQGSRIGTWYTHARHMLTTCPTMPCCAMLCAQPPLLLLLILFHLTCTTSSFGSVSLLCI